MPLPSQSFTRNRLLSTLSSDDFVLLQPHLERVELARGDVLFGPGEPIGHIYFPETGVVSIVASEQNGEQVEVGIVGREGLLGIPILLDAECSPHNCFVQLPPVSALRLSTEAFRRAVAHSATLQARLLRYVQTFLIQSAQTATANASCTMPVRLARWLLMCHDRVDGDELDLTHKFMAMMLAVRRSGVTVTLHTLEATDAIRARRGSVTILDRARLAGIAGGSYGRPEAEYRRLIGPFGKSETAD